MRKFQTLLIVSMLLIMSGASMTVFAQKSRKAKKEKKQGWVQLFDGKTLKGWHIIPGGSWTVEDKSIIARGKKDDVKHGLLVTDKTFKDFEITITYKAIEGNSGLYFRVKEVAGDVGVQGLQAEIDATKDVGGLYETGGRGWVVHPTPDEVKTWYRHGDWNTMTVTARGGNIIVTVNGMKSAEVTNDSSNTDGHIALQIHGQQDLLMMFKDIKIREL